MPFSLRGIVMPQATLHAWSAISRGCLAIVPIMENSRIWRIGISSGMYNICPNITRKFRNVKRNLHCDVVHLTAVWVSSLTLDCNGVFAIKAYNALVFSGDVCVTIQITSLKGGGVLVEKLFCSFFNPVISLYIFYDQYEKYGENTHTIFSHGWWPYSILGHSPRYIQLQNRFFKCSEKLHTHRRHINEETYRSVFTFVEYYIFYKKNWKTHKIWQHFRFFGVKTYS